MTVSRQTAEALFAKATGRKPPAKPTKYRNKKVVVEGITFDSRKEAMRWVQLRQMQEHGRITDLQRQVVFQLAPSVLLHGEFRRKKALTYTADFSYTDEGGNLVIEDVKGLQTKEFRIKAHLMKAYLDLDVRLV